MTQWYQEDLAYIHDRGFSDLALEAATYIIEILHQNNLKDGLIVDLGCGSGKSAEMFIQADYQVLGIDIAESMIRLARQRVPKAVFQVNSLFKAELPNCQAVTLIGEGLNYLFDSDNNLACLTQLFERIYQALILGGMLIFDSLEPGQIGTEKMQSFMEGEDWIVLVEKTEDHTQKRLTRRIITFRYSGETYQRHDEVHQVQLYPSQMLAEVLENMGFQVEIRNSYGSLKLRNNQAVIIASKQL